MRTCKICGDKHHARGLCSMHYQRWRLYGDPHFTLRPFWKSGECKLSICDDKVVAKGLCWKHYQRQRRHGDPHFTLRPFWNSGKCKLSTCDDPHFSNGYCIGHHGRLYRTGSLLDFWIGYELNMTHTRIKKLRASG